jgi:cytidine diphosphoramidate kinase
MEGVVWITGVSGSGKSTLARRVVADSLESFGVRPILLDGDRLRWMLDEQRYDSSTRRSLAGVYGRICLELLEQGFLVVCATISLFWDQHSWNRHHLYPYIEVLIDKPAPGPSIHRNTLAPLLEPPIEMPRAPHLVCSNVSFSDLDVCSKRIIASIVAQQSR